MKEIDSGKDKIKKEIPEIKKQKIETFDDIAKHRETTEAPRKIEPDEIKKYPDGYPLREFHDKNNQRLQLQCWRDRGDSFDIEARRVSYLKPHEIGKDSFSLKDLVEGKNKRIEQEATGYCKIDINEKEQTAYICDIQVIKKDDRRLGIGSNILRGGEAVAKEKGATEIKGTIPPDTDYEELRRFYEKNGYTVKGMDITKDL